MSKNWNGTITEGSVCKGGVNPPNTSNLRPEPPMGSDGKQNRLQKQQQLEKEIAMLENEKSQTWGLL